MLGFRVAVGVVLLVAACDDVGVRLEVQPPPGVDVDTVRLFVADERCSSNDCSDRFRTAASTAAVDADKIYLTKGKTLTASVRDGRAVFTIEPDPDDATRTIPLIIAVGSKDGVINSTVMQETEGLDAREPKRLFITLNTAEAGAASDTVRPMTDHRVDLWSQGAVLDSEDCIAAERWRPGKNELEKRYFIVPEDDHDCDLVVSTTSTPECAPQWPHGQGGSETTYACFSTAASAFPAGQTGPCLLAHPSCSDDTGATGGCVPPPIDAEEEHWYCAPGAACSNTLCMPQSESCVAATLFHSDVHVLCATTPEVSANNSPCTSVATAKVDFSSSMFSPTAASVECTDVRLRSITQTEIGDPMKSLDLFPAGQGSAATMPTLTVSLVPKADTSNATTCEVRFTLDSATTQIRVLLQLSLSNKHELLIPVELVPETTIANTMCSSVFDCSSQLEKIHDPAWEACR